MILTLLVQTTTSTTATTTENEQQQKDNNTHDDTSEDPWVFIDPLLGRTASEHVAVTAEDGGVTVSGLGHGVRTTVLCLNPQDGTLARERESICRG